MSKKSRIRWRESDLQELQRVINNFNAKIYRTRKNHPELTEYLPATISKKQAMNDIYSRADYNKLIASYKRFTQKGSEKIVKSDRGATATRWAIDEFKRNQRAENISRAMKKKQLMEAEVTNTNKPTGYKVKEMGSIRENSLQPSKKKFHNMSMTEFEKASKLFEKKMLDSYKIEQKQQMIRNYMKGLIREGFSDDMISLMNAVDPDTFYQTMITERQASFDFIYDPLERERKEEELKEIWTQKALPSREKLTLKYDDQGNQYAVDQYGEITEIQEDDIIAWDTVYRNVNNININDIEEEILREENTNGRL